MSRALTIRLDEDLEEDLDFYDHYHGPSAAARIADRVFSAYQEAEERRRNNE